jgi:hypothetical protein
MSACVIHNPARTVVVARARASGKRAAMSPASKRARIDVSLRDSSPSTAPQTTEPRETVNCHVTQWFISSSFELMIKKGN